MFCTSCAEHLQKLISGRPILVYHLVNVAWHLFFMKHVVHVISAFFSLQLGVLVCHIDPGMSPKVVQLLEADDVLATTAKKGEHCLHSTQASSKHQNGMRVLLYGALETPYTQGNHLASNLVTQALLHGKRANLGDKLNLVRIYLRVAANDVAHLWYSGAARGTDGDAFAFILIVNLNHSRRLSAGHNPSLHLLLDMWPWCSWHNLLLRVATSCHPPRQ
mmetsp:Transcript_71800/g.126790  ORF Transcript_71800/g.126790 Transcript_71800/m.126790 type:complete len:219 (+) Transcript_71800:1340-1996(+)